EESLPPTMSLAEWDSISDATTEIPVDAMHLYASLNNSERGESYDPPDQAIDDDPFHPPVEIIPMAPRPSTPSYTPTAPANHGYVRPHSITASWNIGRSRIEMVPI
ncbi:hypothetical protein, partial [[Clostridium] innocuum]|uniref:hypothetical protein n=1 Tax=Clostridium innocuum TaxID=1522 RepID=UPI001E2B126C